MPPHDTHPPECPRCTIKGIRTELQLIIDMTGLKVTRRWWCKKCQRYVRSS